MNRQAHAVPVPVDEPLIGGARYDYADAFEVPLSPSDQRSAEEIARSALEDAGQLVPRSIWSLHRHVLRFRLGPLTSREHVLGWTILRSERDVVHIEAVGPILRGVMVIRRADPPRVTAATYVFFARSAIARPLWRILSSRHRALAPQLLDRAATSGARDTSASP